MYHSLSIRPELIWSWRKDTFVIESQRGHDRVGWSYERQSALDHLASVYRWQRSPKHALVDGWLRYMYTYIYLYIKRRGRGCVREEGNKTGERPKGGRYFLGDLTWQKSSSPTISWVEIIFVREQRRVDIYTCIKDKDNTLLLFFLTVKIKKKPNTRRVNSCKELLDERENHEMNSLRSRDVMIK